MDYPTAKRFILTQVTLNNAPTETFLRRLQQQQPPIPGQVTNILLALKLIYESLQNSPEIERNLAEALHCLAFDSRFYYELGTKQGNSWTPLLNEDLNRIERAVRSIFRGQWQP